ncbi:hypothetical protein VTP01DRAFT_1925 [Rhizomucor pusillus]|uniref:uncharacterized protein n=1 Tax=Rhizomucor pusillus TaxID=4840 RepID=UPI00374360DC
MVISIYSIDSPSLLDFDFHPHIHSFSAPKMMPLSTMMVLVYSLDNSTMGSNPSAAVVGLPPDLAPISGPDVTPSKTTPGI